MKPPKHNLDKEALFVTIEKSHWEKNWQHAAVSKRPLSLLNVFNCDATDLLSAQLRTVVKPVIVEIGFAPGKYLQYFEKNFRAECHGYDYSETGCSQAHQFFREQGSSVQIHHQDVLTQLPNIAHPAQLVYSIGVVEHFENPIAMVRAHLAPLAKDGVAIIILPNYQGLNLWIQKRLDPGNLDIHNLSSMTTPFWKRCAVEFPEFDFTTYRYGRLNPWMFSLWRAGKVGILVQLALNFVCFLLPKDVQAWASMFVVEIHRR